MRNNFSRVTLASAVSLPGHFAFCEQEARVILDESAIEVLGLSEYVNGFNPRSELMSARQNKIMLKELGEVISAALNGSEVILEELWHIFTGVIGGQVYVYLMPEAGFVPPVLIRLDSDYRLALHVLANKTRNDFICVDSEESVRVLVLRAGIGIYLNDFTRCKQMGLTESGLGQSIDLSFNAVEKVDTITKGKLILHYWRVATSKELEIVFESLDLDIEETLRAAFNAQLAGAPETLELVSDDQSKIEIVEELSLAMLPSECSAAFSTLFAAHIAKWGIDEDGTIRVRDESGHRRVFVGDKTFRIPLNLIAA